MHKPLGASKRCRALAITALSVWLSVTTNLAQLGSFDPADEGQLFGVRHELTTLGLPGGVTFFNSVLFVADSEHGVLAYDAAGQEVDFPAADWRVDSVPVGSPVAGLIPNQLTTAAVTIETGGPPSTITALLVSDSSTDRVLAFDLTDGSYLFTMRLTWPGAAADVPVINGMALASSSRFVFIPGTSSLRLEGSFAAAWAADFGTREPGAVLVYRDETFIFGDGEFAVAPSVVLSEGAASDGSMREPFGVTFDHQGNLYVIDTVTERLQVYDPDFAPLFVFGRPVPGGTTAEFFEPYVLAFWPDDDPEGPGRLFIADLINNRILAYRPNIAGRDMEYLFTIEGFAIDGLIDAQPYALAIDPASGRLAVSDGSGLTRVWTLQTRNLVAIDLEVFDANGDPAEAVCSGQPYRVDFSLTVPAAWPLVTGVLPALTLGGSLQAPPAVSMVDLDAGQLISYSYFLTAPGTPETPFIGSLPLVAGGTSLSTADILPKRGIVSFRNCDPSNAAPQLTVITNSPKQVSGWTPVHDPFQVTVHATDDSQVVEIAYEFVGTNDLGFPFVPVPNPNAPSNTQSLTLTLVEMGPTTVRLRAKDDDGEWSGWQSIDFFLVQVRDRQSAEGEVVSFTAWDPMIDGPPAAGFRYSAAPLPTGISIDPATGVFSGAATFDAAGDYTVFVTETNPVTGDAREPFSVTWRVTNVNRPPVAAADAYAVAKDVTLTVSAPGVLGNDTDPDGNTLTAALISGPVQGVLHFNADGSFAYTPPAGFVGSVTFTYAVSDGTTAHPGTVMITVSANLPPVCGAATALPSVIWPANHKAVYVTVGGATDPEGAPLSIRFDSIVQDEPADSEGQGHTLQDGGLEADGARAWVRAERAGTKKVPGDGRVYLVGFTATDAGGLSCTGTVRVGVPHDQRGTPAVLSPGRWNSVTGQKFP